MIKKVRVKLKQRSYDVWIGTNATKLIPSQLGAARGRLTVLVYDAKLRHSVLTLEKQLLKAGWKVDKIAIRVNESIKSFEFVASLYQRLSRLHADRSSFLVAIGGGVIGDAVGFVAGTYMRGINWIGVPTTLLAQVDSAIGGKAAINLPGGKNLVGVFHQPSLVVCDLSYLSTLQKRDWISGYGEIIKTALIQDPVFWSIVKKNMMLIRDSRTLATLVKRCIEIKGRIISRDEYDRKGIREVLNFGHSVGHALEAATGYGYFRHGEAVILGIRAAVELSRIRGHLKEKSAHELTAVLASVRVPKIPPKITAKLIFRHMENDKKVRAGSLRFVLLRGVGKPVLDSRVTRGELRESLQILGVH